MKRVVSFVALLTFLFIAFAGLTFGQTELDANKRNEECGQSKETRDPLIDEAEREQFNVRRVEIAGSTYTRDKEFRKRMFFINEGDIFVRKNLEVTVKRISKMSTIYPITMNNVEVRLDRKYRDIDIVFCVKQRPKR